MNCLFTAFRFKFSFFLALLLLLLLLSRLLFFSHYIGFMMMCWVCLLYALVAYCSAFTLTAFLVRVFPSRIFFCIRGLDQLLLTVTMFPFHGLR